MRILTSTYTFPSLSRSQEYNRWLDYIDRENLAVKIKQIISDKDIIWLSNSEYNELISLTSEISTMLSYCQDFKELQSSIEANVEIILSELMKFKTKVTTKCLQL